MRHTLRLIIVGLMALIIVACQTAPEATATLPPTTAPNPPATDAASTAEVTVDVQAVATQIAVDITMPPPGTPVTAAVTQDPLAGASFDSIIFEQTGGITQTTLTVEVYGDGRVVRDGVTSTISAEQLNAINQALQAANIFGLQGQFVMPGVNEDAYYFTITVDIAGAGRTIRAQDGYTPDELMDLFNTISVLGSGA